LNIGTVTLEETNNSIITHGGKTGTSYYGTITETDVLVTYTFDPYTDISSNAISLPNHNLTSGDQIKFRISFEGYQPTNLVDSKVYFVTVINANSIKLSATQSDRIAATFVTIAASAAAGSGKKCYLQLLPRALDFGSTQFTLNTKAQYSIYGTSLVPFNLSTSKPILNSLDKYELKFFGNPGKPIEYTANIFKGTVLGVSVRTWKSPHEYNVDRPYNKLDYINAINENKSETLFISFDNLDEEKEYSQFTYITYKKPAHITFLQYSCIKMLILSNCNTLICNRISTFSEMIYWISRCKQKVIPLY
jgi:hypothetical protein